MTKSLLKRVVESISLDKRKFVKRQGEFAAKIDELLESTGMTQRELAKKLGKQESYVSKMLSGWSNPTLKTIAEFEVALGKDIVDFNLESTARSVVLVSSFQMLCKEPSGMTQRIRSGSSIMIKPSVSSDDEKMLPVAA